MKPLYKPLPERVATRKALVRALNLCVGLHQTETDPDRVQQESCVVCVAVTFALTPRRIALAVCGLRTARRDRINAGQYNEEEETKVMETKATTLIQASGYFPH